MALLENYALICHNDVRVAIPEFCATRYVLFYRWPLAKNKKGLARACLSRARSIQCTPCLALKRSTTTPNTVFFTDTHIFLEVPLAAWEAALPRPTVLGFAPSKQQLRYFAPPLKSNSRLLRIRMCACATTHSY